MCLAYNFSESEPTLDNNYNIANFKDTTIFLYPYKMFVKILVIYNYILYIY